MNSSRVLQHMGITKWHSRYQMPNAAKSILIEAAINEVINEPQLETISAQTPSTTEHSKTRTAAPTTPISNAAQEAIQSVTISTQVDSKPAEQEPIIPQKTPKFRYQAICINQFFCFVPLNLENQQDISTFQLQFLQNVIFAKTNEKPNIIKTHIYQWPLFKHERAEQGLSVAQSFFKEQLITHQQDLKFEQVLIFGNLLEDLELNADEIKKAVKELNIIPLPTLEQSMHSSHAKQSLWQLIK
ncbi:hypothetical protein [Marinicellulosiphila megalodicopiae]|uniref:hypothetical protein n=1 Tax=Marinicellulosiphila megalodicopiae TaxID=2724896 RepID=UPI003BAFAF91